MTVAGSARTGKPAGHDVAHGLPLERPFRFDSNALDEALMRLVKDGDLAHAEAAFVGYARSAR